MLFSLKLAGGQYLPKEAHRFHSRMANLIKVQVRQGIVVGRQKRLPNGLSYHCFQGIPYAVPPLGELRFKSPVPLDRFNEAELDCTSERDVSHHRDPFTQKVIGSEDCLFLNVYAPQNSNNKLLPVMVYIHGGGFTFGSGNSDNYLPLSLMEEGVLVVTLNYRLGLLGFLSLPEAGIWGNAGLKDQRLALQWLHENISNFNGDPQNVTIFGESAGAASVHLHAYSNHAHKLFHKAIMQSGTANMEWVFQPNPEHKTRRLAKLLGCQSHNSHDVLQFLQSPQVTPLQLLSNSTNVLSEDERRRGLPLPFKPVLEDTSSPDGFITTPIMERLRQHDTLAMPIIMGYNSAEGIVMLVNAIRKLEQYDKDLERLVPRNIPLSAEDSQIRAIAQKMREFYFGGRALSPEEFNALTNLLTDYHFIVDMQNAAELQVRHQPRAPLYFYRFNYVGRRNMFKRIFQLEHLDGACHADELCYLFQMAGDNEPATPEDAKIIKVFSTLWANFARCGEPTPGGCGMNTKPLGGCNWAPVRRPLIENEAFTLDYLAIDKECKMRQNPDRERIEFWRNIYRTYKPIDYSRLSAKL